MLKINLLSGSLVLLLLTQFGNGQETTDDIERIMPVSRMLTVVPPEVKPNETYSMPRPVSNIKGVNFDPIYFPKSRTLSELTRQVIMRHDVGCLEFTHKPLRVMEVEVPHISGKMQKKLVTYLIYRVRNIGGHVASREERDELGHPQSVIETNQSTISPSAGVEKFDPHFVLEGWIEDFAKRTYRKKSYLDVYHPYVVQQIERADRTPAKLHDMATISKQRISYSEDPNALGTWGVAIWEDVDPKINYFSIFLKGLTNAYRVSVKSDGTPVARAKTLQMNFYRSGDAKSLNKDLIRSGIPLTKSLELQAVYAKFYGLPGPSIEVSEVEVFDPREAPSDKSGANRSRPLFEVDADFNKNFDSTMFQTLKSGRIPPEVKQQFTALGIDTSGVTLKEVIAPKDPDVDLKPGTYRWDFTIRDGERTRQFQIDHMPRFWARRGKGVVILNPVENLWIYR